VLGVGAVAIDDDDAGAVVAHGARHGEPEAVGAACHHNDFVRDLVELFRFHALVL
jgi:hypothetical protein